MPRKVDIRLLTTTKVDLADFVRQGKFREDFYHRIVVLSIMVPPLRERVGTNPIGIAIAPNGLFALVANDGSNSISPINLSNPMVPTKGTNLTVGTDPESRGPSTIYFR